MRFQIRLGVPEFETYYGDLAERARCAQLDKDEVRIFKQITKALGFLHSNPQHNSLNSHEITPLSQRYSKAVGRDIKVWQSYLENNTPAAGRLYWVYGPNRAEITVIGIAPHPEDQKGAGYSKVRLSGLPPG